MMKALILKNKNLLKVYLEPNDQNTFKNYKDILKQEFKDRRVCSFNIYRNITSKLNSFVCCK